MKVAIFDIETDGFLRQMTKVHVCCIRLIEDGRQGPTLAYKSHEMGAALAELSSADVVVGHNIVSFDIPALEKIYPDWVLPETVLIRDTLVMARMCFSNIKDKDFRLFEAGTLQGKYIGQHKLEAWGERLGVSKGDYREVREKLAAEQGITDPDEIRRFVWGEWNQDMEDYCVQDVEVTTALWNMIEVMKWNDVATKLEHRIHHIMFLQEEFGFTFDIPEAQKLSGQINEAHDALHAETVAHFGKWFRPKKMWKHAPREEFGEDSSRKTWAEITRAKKTLNYKQTPVKVTMENGELVVHGPLSRPIRTEGELFCEVELMEFNPNSRPQIIDRLTKIYQWEPVDFTEKGNPQLDDDVLQNLVKHIPICENLAELFFLTKLLGQLENGKNAWLALVSEDGRIHGYVNTGGTVSGRASHLSPNCAQVPKVAVVDPLKKEGREKFLAGEELTVADFNKKVIDKKTGKPFPYVFDAEGRPKKKVILLGRAGKYGFECRRLFGPPPGWWQMGCDLSGIELRCLAARLAEFDGGEYVLVVLDGDPHSKNQIAFQLDSRDNAKTCLYAIMYGGGDEKVGSIVLPPSATVGEMKARGRTLKANLQSGIPAFGALIRKVGREAGRGFLTGLDGRKLFVRSKHAALNLQLQSDAALISKLWVVFFFDMMEEAGYVHGVDWGMMAWVHDEIQAACRTKEIAEHAAEICKEAAKLAGEWFDYRAPVAADSKIGKNWAETH